MKELRYPILYAVMEIEDQVGWNKGLNELERNMEVVANIVSKCYVVSEKTKYNSDGSTRKTYEVVFPFKNREINKSSIPEYNIYQQCTNSVIVDELFNTFEEAQKESEKMNEELVAENLSCVSFTKYNEEKVKQYETINKYKCLEKVIEEKTSDTIISTSVHNNSIKEKVLRMKNNN